jgi:RNA polymerase sigma-70 factor, ECF subfamily
VLHTGGIEVIEGDARTFAYGELQARLRPFVARRAYPNDVDDVLQEIFLRVQRGLPDLRDDQRFGPWVYQIARSAIADQRRVRARHPLAAGEPPEEAAPATEGEERSAEQLLAQVVVPFIAMLPSPYREALTLTELEGLTQKQAAEMLGVSLTGMKSRVQRGRARLRRLLEDCCEIALDARGRVVGCVARPGRKPPCEC